MSGYATADTAKKALIDGFYQSKMPKGSDSIYAMLQAGQSVPPDAMNGADYKNAKTRYDSYNRYSSYTAEQIATAMKGGELVPGTVIYNDLTKNPDIKTKMDKAKALNFTNGNDIDTNKVVSNTMSDIMLNSPLGKALADGFISGEEANDLTSTPEIKAKEAKILELKNDYDTKIATYQ